MQLTFGHKQVPSFSMTMILILLTMLSAYSCATVNGWQVDSDESVILDDGDSCQTPTGTPGVCKRISICGPYVKRQIKYNALRRCSFIGNEEITCCPESGTGGGQFSTFNWQNSVDPTVRPTTTSTTTTTTTTTTISPIVIGDITLTVPTPSSTVETVTTRTANERPSQAACRRWRDVNPAALTFHILDGVPVAPGDYPHMGGLIFPVGGGEDIDIRCGTSLIAEQYVLTAAHCVNDPVAQPTAVRFGVVIWNSTADDSMLPVDVDIESITIHSEYRAPLRYHDVAVIRLRRPVEFTPFIRPACLYSDMGDVDSATPLVVIGWGVTNVQTRSRSEVLLMTNVTTVPLSDCNATHVAQGVQRTYRNGLNEGHYCAFDPELKKDACQADSGGPLQLVVNKESTIVGIVSFGLSCGSAVPSVYARVAYYLQWIESVVWPS